MSSVVDIRDAGSVNRLPIRNMDTPMQILPIGDSITVGFKSSDNNGYRLDLRKLLVAAGTTGSI
jgi:hypothetical protein